MSTLLIEPAVPYRPKLVVRAEPVANPDQIALTGAVVCYAKPKIIFDPRRLEAVSIAQERSP